MEEVSALGIEMVEVTGGEPLVHHQAIGLMQGLLDRGHRVLLETSGSRDISKVPEKVHIILDLKPPDSGEERSNLWSNIPLLRSKDEVKFVLASRRDYEWAREKVREHRLHERCSVLFSCAFGKVKPTEVTDWILQDRLAVRFQLQLHKILWDPEARGV